MLAGHAASPDSIQRSHLRLDGTQDLGGGLTATVALSHRFDPGNGALESSTKAFWHGQSTVGLKEAFGSIQFGRRLDALYSLDWEFDPWASFDRVASPAWDLWHVNFPSDPGGNGGAPEHGRLNNGAFDDSAQVAGFSLHLSGSLERCALDAGRAGGVALRHALGPVSAVAARDRNSRGDTASFLGVRAALGALDMMGARDITRSGTSAASSWTLGTAYTTGLLPLKTGWGRLTIDGNVTERMLGLGASYALSKRTALSADVGHRRFATGNVTSTGIGVSHRF